MLKQLTFVLPILALAACQTTTMSKEPAKNPLAPVLDRVLTNENSKFSIKSDGTFTGDASGTYVVENGQFCRTVITPEKWAGTQCQDVVVDGDKVTFVRPDGSSNSYTIN
jgi:uncharacterized lipoprotein YajG